MLLALAVLALQSAPGAVAVVDLTQLLAEYADRSAPARFPRPPYRLEGAIATAAHELDREQVREHVLFAAEGPGSIVRVVARDAAVRLRVVVDHGAEPVIDATLQDLSAETRSGLAVLELPISFARSVSVTTSDPAARLAWRRYAPGTAVASFTRDDVERAARGVEAARRGWERPVEGEETFRFSLSRANPAGELLANAGFAVHGPRAISELRLQLDARDPDRALATCVLRMSFDGAETVAVPLGAFFGVHDELLGRRDALRTVTATGLLVARFVMPYRESFALRIDNAGDPELHVSGSLRTIPWAWDERSLHFHADWIPTSPPGARRLRVAGQGVLLGEDLVLANPGLLPVRNETVRTRLDGVPLAVLLGLGAEELLAQAWPASREFATPLQGASFRHPLAPFGRAHLYAFRVLDRAPFERELDLAAEDSAAIEPRAPRASTLFWYGGMGARADAPPLSRDPSTWMPALPFPTIADAVEAETAVVSAPVALELTRRSCEGLACSGGLYLRGCATRRGAQLEIRVPSVPGRRAIRVLALRASEFGRVHFAVNGQAVDAAFDARSTVPIDARGAVAELEGPVLVDLGAHEVGDSFLLLVDVAELGTGPGTFGIDAIVVR